MKNLTIIIITGQSGSGKSTALAALEDAGFYCVDNLPVALLPKFLEMPVGNAQELAGLAFVMDAREKTFLERYPSVFDALRLDGYLFQILFLESNETVLLQRYSQTRRQHPLGQGRSLIESIRAEQRQLLALRAAADRIIDTSRRNVHELKTIIREIAQKSIRFAPLRIHVLSFGFKYGIPADADLIMDVRFLPNPYFVAELKAQDGEAAPVRDFLLEKPETVRFLEKYLDLLDYLIPLYEKEGKSYLTIAIGCTGGRHRSVTLARRIYEHIARPGRQVAITHRDIAQAV
jgi:UPF0042 nucleotide-binding protein